jgi:hypothetical protein
MRDMKDYKDRVKKMFKQLHIDTQKKYEKNVSDNTRFIVIILEIEKDVSTEWNDCSVHTVDRLRTFHHERGRFSCYNV